ncbi:TraM recognition domain-containing protein, partial [Patescibacteria group bacterium]|nr:TraM recognition domain-containing protein [Patescibacteria group bacterium]
SFDIRTLMDERKILLINLSKGLVGDTNMQLLGSMLTTRIFLAAMSRANLPAHELAKAPNFYFYVDEFQNFANQTFSEILSEARKYHLNLLLAHQYVAQMEEEVQAAVFGNVGTTVSFRVGPLDAELLEKVFTPEFLQEDLVNLGFAQVYLSLMIDGIGSRPFSGVTIPPIEAPQNSHRSEVIQHSRTVFGTSRQLIEDKVQTEYSEVHEQAPKVEPKQKAPVRQAPRSTERAPEKQKPRPEPAAKTKTASDLKEILRSTIAASQKEQSKKQDSKKDVLQKTLREVVGEKPQEKKESPAPSVFEVPEETLRSIFKDV